MFSVMKSAGGECLAHGLMGYPILTGQLAETVGLASFDQFT